MDWSFVDVDIDFYFPLTRHKVAHLLIVYNVWFWGCPDLWIFLFLYIVYDVQMPELVPARIKLSLFCSLFILLSYFFFRLLDDEEEEDEEEEEEEDLLTDFSSLKGIWLC